MPRKRIAVGGRPVELSDAQYRTLRYWADNTVDQGFDYARQHPNPPRIMNRTIDVLARHRLWFWIPSGFIVLDAGRRAVGLPPADRDIVCPACGAGRGERCHITTRRPDGSRYLTGGRMNTVHPERTGTPEPLPPRDTAPTALDVIAAVGGTDIAARLRDPHDVHHLGYGTAT